MTHRTRLASLSLATVLGTLGVSAPAFAQQNPFGAIPALVQRIPQVVFGQGQGQGQGLPSLGNLPSIGRWAGQQDDAQDDSADDDSAAQGDDDTGCDGAGDRADSDDDSDSEPTPAPAPAPNAQGGRTFGIFVGVSQYGGENHDLPGSADDAVQLARAFERAGWMERSNAVVLTDANASLANVRQAFRQMASRVTANDTLVFFYDGHGNTQVLDTVGPDLSRSELGRLMRTVQGHQLLVLDSCEAGGFAPLVQGRSGRAGLFSSRANENSQTAPEVNAGGWLAYFMRQAVAGGVRRGPDGAVDLSEVVRYVEARYQRQGITDRQHLVAVQPRGETFALGGAGNGTVTTTPTDVAVARNDAPARRPGRGDMDFGQVFETGLGLAGRVVNALTK
ncbi:MAG: caspase family protein [Polyangiales bacterium]